MALTCPDKSKSVKRQLIACFRSILFFLFFSLVMSVDVYPNKKYVHLEEGCWSDSFSKGTPLVKRFVECRIFVVFFGSSDC